MRKVIFVELIIVNIVNGNELKFNLSKFCRNTPLG